MRRLVKWMCGLLWRSERWRGRLSTAGSCCGRYTAFPRSNASMSTYGWTRAGAAGQNAPLREHYYYTAQGTSMPQGASVGAVRYSWFVNLELPLSRERFAAPDHMRRWRFLVDPEPTAGQS